MRVMVEGNVTSKMLAGAILKAHAAAAGTLKEKQAAGVGHFNQYLADNSARREAWDKLSRLPVEVVLARASLADADLKEAERLFEATTDPDQRRALLNGIITPHFSAPVLMFGSPVPAMRTRRLLRVAASVLENGLQPQLSARQLVMMAYRDGEREKFVAKDQVTNEQYGIFMAQTGHVAPVHWESPKSGKMHPLSSVIGVHYDNDVVVFANWMGRKVLSLTEFSSAKAAIGPALTADRSHEWAAKEGEDYCFFWLHDSRKDDWFRGYRGSETLLAFRVGED